MLLFGGIVDSFPCCWVCCGFVFVKCSSCSCCQGEGNGHCGGGKWVGGHILKVSVGISCWC